MIGRLFCWLGLHFWWAWWRAINEDEHELVRKCLRCGRSDAWTWLCGDRWEWK